MVLARLKILYFLLLATALFMYGCRDKPAPKTGREARAEALPDLREKTPDVLVQEPDKDVSPEPVALTRLDPESVLVEVSPAVLDVLEPATLSFSATLPRDRRGLSCRWILSSGADAALDGCRVTEDLAEAGADVAWTLVIIEDETELLRRDGVIPLERLPRIRAPREEPPPQEKNAQEIIWSLTPDELGVLQDTDVILAAMAPAGTECIWYMEGGESPLTGCQVTHLFKEAHRDQMVTLKVLQGEEVLYSGTRALPLERLSVTRRASRPEGDMPSCEDDCRRLAVASVSGDAGLDLAFALATSADADALALFLQAPIPEATAVEDLARHLGARGIGLIPVACGDGLDRHSLTALLTNHALSAGLVLHSDAADLPARYALQWGPAFIAALPTRADIPDEKWLSGQLETAAMFRTRILLSCRAFDQLTGAEVKLLPSPYRQYEKMRRGGLSVFISSAHDAFYPGTYGNLRTLSPGRAQGPSEALLGQKTQQGPTAALLDLDEDRILRVTGVVPTTDGWALLPADRLPEKVGVYRLWR